MANDRSAFPVPDCAAAPVSGGVAGDGVDEVCAADDLGSVVEGAGVGETTDGIDAAGGAGTTDGGVLVCCCAVSCALAGSEGCPSAAAVASAVSACAAGLEFNQVVRAGEGTKVSKPTRFI